MRYSRLRKNRVKNIHILGIILILIAGIVVYFLSAGIVGRLIGTFITSHLKSPVIQYEQEEGLINTDSSEISKPLAERVKSSIKIPGYIAYAIQLGAFTDENNAKAFADEIRTTQLAGYILDENGVHKVMAFAFTERSLADAAKRDLKSKNIDAQIYVFQTKAANVEINATQDNATLIAQCFDDLKQWIEILSLQSSAIFQENFNEQGLISFIEQNSEQIKARKDRLYKLKENNSDNAVLVGLVQLYDVFNQQMADILSAKSDLSKTIALVRFDYIEILDKYRQYRQQ